MRSIRTDLLVLAQLSTDLVIGKFVCREEFEPTEVRTGRSVPLVDHCTIICQHWKLSDKVNDRSASLACAGASHAFSTGIAEESFPHTRLGLDHEAPVVGSIVREPKGWSGGDDGFRVFIPASSLDDGHLVSRLGQSCSYGDSRSVSPDNHIVEGAVPCLAVEKGARQGREQSNRNRPEHHFSNEELKLTDGPSMQLGNINLWA